MSIDIQEDSYVEPGRNRLEKVLDKATHLPFSFLIILVVIFGLFFPSIGYEYSQFQDGELIENRIDQLANWSNVGDVLLGRISASPEKTHTYRPMMTLSLMMDAWWGGGSIVAFRISNLILQSLIGFFLFRLFMQLGYNRILAFLISIATVVNPFMLHSILWLPARGDLLLVLFGILSIIAFIRFSETGTPVFFALNMLFYAFALLTNEAAIFLPIVFIAYLLVYKRRQLFVVEDITLYMIWAAISGTWFYFKSLSEEYFKCGQHTGNAFLHNLDGIPFVIGKMALPTGLTTFQPYDGLSTTIGVVLIVLLVVRVITKKSKQWNRLIFTFSMAVITSLAFLNSGNGFTGLGYDIVNSRAYLFAVGFIIFSVELLPSRMKEAGRILPIAAACASIVYFSVFSVANAGAYRNADSFFGNAIKENPNCPAVHYYYGKYLAKQHNAEASINELDKAVSLKSDYVDAYISRGEVRAGLGEFESALADFELAHNMDPSESVSRFRLADMDILIGRYDKALLELDELIGMHPHDAAPYNARGKINTRMMRFDRALDDFKESLKFDPNQNEVYMNRGLVYIELKDFISACNDLEKSRQMGNKDAESLLQKYCSQYIVR